MSNTKPLPLRPGTKLAGLVTALQQGATIENLGAGLGWQPHTVRAALTRLRQRGYRIERKEGVYSLKAARGKKS